MNLNQSCDAIVSYRIKCDFGNWPLCDITRFFFNERIIAVTLNYQGMSAKNVFLLQIEEIVRIYANSKYLDSKLLWVLTGMVNIWYSFFSEEILFFLKARPYIFWLNRHGGLEVWVSAPWAGGRGFDPLQRQIKVFETGSCGFPSWRSGLWE